MIGRRVILRDLAEPDLAAHAHWLAPEQLWHSLDGPYYPKPKSEDIPARVERLRAKVVAADFPNPRVRLAIADRATDAYIGSVSWYLEEDEPPWHAAGIVLYDPSTWRQGLGYEALGLWVDYLLHAHADMHRLTLWTWSGNLGMMRLAEKLGFREEARYREQRVVEDRRYDSLGYGLLRREWAARYPRGFAAALEVT